MRPPSTSSTSPVGSPRTARSSRALAFVLSVLSAGVLAFAPVGASAGGVDERRGDDAAAEAEARELSRLGEFVAASRAWAAIAASSEDPQTRAVAAFRGYQASVSAYEAEGDVASLCVARGLVSGLAADAEVDLPIREDAERRLAEIEGLLSDGELAGTCEVEPLPQPPADPSPLEADPPVGPALLPVRTPSAEPPGRGAGASSATGDFDDVRDPSASSEQVRRFRVAGVFTVTAGAALLGAMTYGLVVDARAAADLREYQSKAEQGALSAADWWRIEGLRSEGRSATQLATATGIVGGVALVSGVALLLAGRRLDRRGRGVFASSPTPRVGFGVGKGNASLMLRGRF